MLPLKVQCNRPWLRSKGLYRKCIGASKRLFLKAALPAARQATSKPLEVWEWSLTVASDVQYEVKSHGSEA